MPMGETNRNSFRNSWCCLVSLSRDTDVHRLGRWE